VGVNPFEHISTKFSSFFVLRMSWEDGIGRRGPLFADMLIDSKPSPDSGQARLSEEGLGSVFLRLGCNGVRFGSND
jgi:hypothetical protein